MKTEIVKLSHIQTNNANPRHIKDDKFAKLVNSILVFPKMLELRPIVVDDTLVSLGGNMRYRGLTFIAEVERWQRCTKTCLFSTKVIQKIFLKHSEK